MDNERMDSGVIRMSLVTMTQLLIVTSVNVPVGCGGGGRGVYVCVTVMMMMMMMAHSSQTRLLGEGWQSILSRSLAVNLSLTSSASRAGSTEVCTPPSWQGEFCHRMSNIIVESSVTRCRTVSWTELCHWMSNIILSRALSLDVWRHHGQNRSVIECLTTSWRQLCHWISNIIMGRTTLSLDV